jgi:hypothetical protein
MNAKKHKHTYLVGYFYAGGHGSAIVSRRRKVKTMDDINDLCSTISNGIEGHPNVAVFSYQKIGGVFP